MWISFGDVKFVLRGVARARPNEFNEDKQAIRITFGERPTVAIVTQLLSIQAICE
jgi:hypothetical protein